MTETELLEHADYLLKLALSKNPNMDDAEDLVSETLISALKTIRSGKKIENPKAFLSGILFHKFTDGLRKKYSKPVLYEGLSPDLFQAYEPSVLDKMIMREEAENIRKSIASQTRIYREVLVRHYIHGQSVGKISEELGVPVNTVKSRLNTARQNVKQEFNLNMEKFEKESYEPQWLTVGVSGVVDNPDFSPFEMVNEDRIAQNLLILAYENPVTIPELAGAIGISVAYIEPVIDRLLEYDFMKKTGDKVATNFVIYKDEDYIESAKYDKALAEKLYRPLWEDLQPVLGKLRSQEFYERQGTDAKTSLEFYTMLMSLQYINAKMTLERRGLKFGLNMNESDDFYIPHKGWHGYALGNLYTTDFRYDWDYFTGYLCTRLNGCHTVEIPDYKGLKSIATHAYDISCGWTFSRWYSLPAPLSDTSVAKALYAIYSGTEDDLCVINSRFFEDIEELEALKILRSEKVAEIENKLFVNIPVLTETEHKWLKSEIIFETINGLYEKYKEDFQVFFQHPVKVPEHLKEMKDFYGYLIRGYCFPVAVMYQMIWNGLYLAGRDFQKDPIPVMVMTVDEKK